MVHLSADVQAQYLGKSELVTSALREMVITGEFAPGTALRQRDLAQMFNVSPTPIREALRRLESEGLVQYDLHRGATVAAADYEAADENFQIRAVLESLAVGLSADRISLEQLEALDRLNDSLASCGDDKSAAREINRNFHFGIYRAAHSPTLLAMLQLLWHSFPQAGAISRPVSVSVRQHRQILRALRAHDRQRAEDLTRTHILSARTNNSPPAGRAGAGQQTTRKAAAGRVSGTNKSF